MKRDGSGGVVEGGIVGVFTVPFIVGRAASLVRVGRLQDHSRRSRLRRVFGLSSVEFEEGMMSWVWSVLVCGKERGNVYGDQEGWVLCVRAWQSVVESSVVEIGEGHSWR